ncbi:MAG: SpoIIIAH-like family protein [Clostridiaceae bacterium]|nr:SpoIIIAH-like family protein [Clostridiaceae bacterium]
MKFSQVGKKNFVIFSLVVMLGLIGYVNYNLNKQSLLQTSSELEQYKMSMMEESGVLVDLLESEEMDLVDTADIEDKDIDTNNVMMVDSKDHSEIEDFVEETSAEIAEVITNKELMKSNIYFIESKLERDKKRSEMISYLNDIINNELTSEEMRNQAQGLKLNMITGTEREVLLENMIISKGFNDAVVHLTDKSVNVVVNSNTLTEGDVAKIVDIIRRETNIGMDRITIMNKK